MLLLFILFGSFSFVFCETTASAESIEVTSDFVLTLVGSPTAPPLKTTTFFDPTTSESSSTTTPSQVITCPPSWYYSSFTGYCYGVYHNKNWIDAEQKCVEEGAHLASIHREEEAYLVAGFTRRFSSPTYGDQTLIGLTLKENGKAWEWSDGSRVDYLPWGEFEPYEPSDTDHCVLLWSYLPGPYDPSDPDFWRDFSSSTFDKFGEFHNFSCDQYIKNFVCQKSPN